MSSARNRVFVTETIGDPIPIVFFGGDTPLKKEVISQLSDKKPEFVGISDSKLSRYPSIQPYRVVWIMSGEEDWESAVAYASFSQTPLIVVVYGGEAEHISSQVLRSYSNSTALQFSHTPSSSNQSKCVSLILGGVFQEFKKGQTSLLHISPPEEKYVDKGEISNTQKVSQKTHQSSQDLRKRMWVTEVEEAQTQTSAFQPPLNHQTLKSQHIPQQPEWKITQPKLQHIRTETLKPFEVQIPLASTRLKIQTSSALFSHLPTEKEVEKRHHISQVESKNPSDQIGKTLERVFSFTSSQSKINEKSTGISLRSSGKGSEKKQSLTQKFVLILGTILLVFGVPIFSFIFLSSSFTHHSKVLYSSLQNAHESTPLVQLESASQSTKVFDWMIRSLYSITDIVGLSTPLEKYRQAIELSHKGVTAMKSLTKLRVTLGRVYVASMQGGNEDPLELLSLANTQVEQASKDLALFSSELATVPDKVPMLDKVKAKDVEQQVGSIRRSLVKTQHLIGVLPRVLGQEKKKTYLVLIQNPLELRPSGGFLESFALVTVDKGRVLDIQVQDVIQADNVLKGKIEPPVDLKAQLGESQWFFRDSNWSTQFPLVAQQAEWFIQKELGRSVDGTIAINAYTLQDFLKIIGPVTLAGQQQEVVSADNILERLFTKSESLFRGPTSSTKSFLSSVSEQVFVSMQKLALNKAEAVGVAVFNGLERGHIVMSLRDKEEQQTLSLLGITGAVMTPPCPQAFADNSCVVDTLYQVDANVGVNRANYALTRYFEHRVVLSQNVAAHTYIVHYANTSASTAWPSGSYRNYIRLVLPDFSQVNSVVVDKKPLSSSLIAQHIQYGKREVGFQIEVPVGKSVEVQVNYVTTFLQPKKFSYALFTQKQAGTMDDPISLTVNVQKPLRTTKLAPEGAVLGNVVQFDTTLDRHQYLAVELQ